MKSVKTISTATQVKSTHFRGSSGSVLETICGSSLKLVMPT